MPWTGVDPVVATVLAKTSHGFNHLSVGRGRPLSCRATASRSSCEWLERSLPLGKYRHRAIRLDAAGWGVTKTETTTVTC